jgi:hypothetical protein
MVDNLRVSMRTQGWINSQSKRVSLIVIKISNKNKIKNNDHQDNSNNIADNPADNNDDYNNDDYDNDDYDNDDNNIQPEQETIVIPNPKNPMQQITFQCKKNISTSL